MIQLDSSDSKRILLVEDNPDDESLALRAFRKTNLAHIVEVARDGEEAIEYLFDDDLTRLPDLVLLDIKLPKLDGLEVLARIRKNEKTRLIPVVLLTSSDEEHDLTEGYRLGANSYVRKPVDFIEFIEVFQHLTTYWLRFNASPPRPPV